MCNIHEQLNDQFNDQNSDRDNSDEERHLPNYGFDDDISSDPMNYHIIVIDPPINITTKPDKEPTNEPTNKPTNKPTNEPTTEPTTKPTTEDIEEESVTPVDI
jgi:PT repeat